MIKNRLRYFNQQNVKSIHLLTLDKIAVLVRAATGGRAPVVSFGRPEQHARFERAEFI